MEESTYIPPPLPVAELEVMPVARLNSSMVLRAWRIGATRVNPIAMSSQ